MPKKKNKRMEFGDMFAIEQYSFDTPETEEKVTLRTSSLINSRKKIKSSRISKLSKKSETTMNPHTASRTYSEAQKKLNSLILKDIAEFQTLKKITADKKVTKARDVNQVNQLQEKKFKESKSSTFVIDLRKHYLIEKNKLHSFDKPDASISSKLSDLIASFFIRKKVKWHIPKRVILESEEKKKKVKELEDHDNLEPISHRMKRNALVTFAFILIIIVIPVPIVSYFNQLLTTQQLIESKGGLALSKLRAGVLNLADKQLSQAEVNLSAARLNFSSVNEILENYNKILQQLITYIPSVSDKFHLAQNVAIIGEHTAEIGKILSVSFSNKPDSPKITENLANLRHHFQRIEIALIDSRSEIQSIDITEMPEQWQNDISALQQNYENIIDAITRVGDVLYISNSILGGDKPSRYLFLFQNNRELRPTGGFIGSYALIDLYQGHIQKIEFPGGGVYDLTAGFKQHLLPPEPISIVNQEWFLWDANWWPDFPTSAQKISWFYENSGGPTVDGIIAVNSDVMVNLLNIIGPIDLPEYDTTITGDNFYEVIQTEVELNYDKNLNQPKKILNDLFTIILEKIFASSDYQNLLALLAESLSVKDIQMATLTNEEVQTQIKKLGWSGSLRKTDKDYLNIISTNIAGGKSDSSIYQTVDHQAYIQNSGEITVTLTITKEHRGEPSDIFGYVNNVDYLRIYVPRGSQLISTYGFKRPSADNFRIPADYQVTDTFLESMRNNIQIEERSKTEIYDEQDFTVFANWMQVEPGEATEVIVKYKLPFRIDLTTTSGTKWLNPWQKNYKEVDAYSLLIQKQAGKRNTIINSAIHVPERYQIIWSDAVDEGFVSVTPQLFSFSSSLEYDTYYAFLLGNTSK